MKNQNPYPPNSELMTNYVHLIVMPWTIYSVSTRLSTQQCQRVCDWIVVFSGGVVENSITTFCADDSQASIDLNNIDSGYSDDLDMTSVSISRSPFSCDDLGANTAELTLTDTGNQASSYTPIITVLEDIPPAIVSINPDAEEELVMRDDLRITGALPLTSPYERATCDASVFSVSGSDAKVDWALTELREPTVSVDLGGDSGLVYGGINAMADSDLNGQERNTNLSTLLYQGIGKGQQF